MVKALIVFGTRYGATEGTSKEIASELKNTGFDVNVINAKTEKIMDISGFDLIVVGSGMQMGKWTGEAEDFLKSFQKDIVKKRHALFVSSMKTVSEREGKMDDVAEIRKVALDDKVKEYKLNPIALGFFGGVMDYNKMNFLFRRTMGFLKPQLEKDGFKEQHPGFYDLRDWDEIRSWAKELAEKAKI